MASSGANLPISSSGMASPDAAAAATTKSQSMVNKFQNLRFPNYLLPSFDFKRWQRNRQLHVGAALAHGSRENESPGSPNQNNHAQGVHSWATVDQGESAPGAAIAVGRSNSDSDSDSISSYNTTITSPHSATATEEAESGAGEKSSQYSVSPQTKGSPRENKRREPIVGSTTYMKCRKCQSDICFSSDIISKGFMGRHGRAYLIKSLPPHTHTLSKPISRQLVTGTHIVSDICCSVCQINLGWKYVNAEEEAQRYKIGKYILETKKMVKMNRWEQTYPSPDSSSGLDDDNYENERVGKREQDDNTPHQLQRPTTTAAIATSSSRKNKPGLTSSYSSTSYPVKEQDMWDRELEMAEILGDVNSEDEDELEDMFLGRWTPKLAAKRRKVWEKKLAKNSGSSRNNSPATGTAVNHAASSRIGGDGQTTAPIARRATA